MATGDNPLEVLFPLKGVDVSTEFELQPELTTPVGVNVRAYEPVTGRGRGGSRPGLSKYIAGQIPEGAELIQHLNIVVDPTIAALITTFNDFDGTPGAGQDDPSSNNGPIPRQPTPRRRIRVGGSGIAPNRHIGADDQPIVPPWPPPPPPPPGTGNTVVVTYDLDSTFQDDFSGVADCNGSTSFCSCIESVTVTIEWDGGSIGVGGVPLTYEQAIDTIYLNSLIAAQPGGIPGGVGLTGVNVETTDECECD